MITSRNPRAEAARWLADGHEARVLEPSMPASVDPDFFADDPTDPSGAAGIVVSPVGDGDLTWDEYVANHPDVGGFAKAHWLGDLARLAELPAGYTETRKSLHQLAFFAVAPKRYEATGKLGLRYTYRGFGTPFFGRDEQVRVEAGRLVVQVGGDVRSTVPESVSDAVRFVDLDYRETWFEAFHDPLAPVDPDASLAIDVEAARSVGDWFGFSTHVLERARRISGAVDVSRVQLWPEHFDPAFEMGDADAGHRASYGASPGDDGSPEPYLYVAAWGEIDRADSFWNAQSFNGALLTYSDLLVADDQVSAALSFFTAGYEALAAR